MRWPSVSLRARGLQGPAGRISSAPCSPGSRKQAGRVLRRATTTSLCGGVHCLQPAACLLGSELAGRQVRCKREWASVRWHMRAAESTSSSKYSESECNMSNAINLYFCNRHVYADYTCTATGLGCLRDGVAWTLGQAAPALLRSGKHTRLQRSFRSSKTHGPWCNHEPWPYHSLTDCTRMMVLGSQSLRISLRVDRSGWTDAFPQ